VLCLLVSLISEREKVTMRMTTVSRVRKLVVVVRVIPKHLPLWWKIYAIITTTPWAEYPYTGFPNKQLEAQGKLATCSDPPARNSVWFQSLCVCFFFFFPFYTTLHLKCHLPINISFIHTHTHTRSPTVIHCSTNTEQVCQLCLQSIPNSWKYKDNFDK